MIQISCYYNSNITELKKSTIQSEYICLKMMTNLAYSGNDIVYQISSESPEFCRRYYKKKHFGLFFSGHTVYCASEHTQK